jgi:hypothetical protein
MYVSFNQSKPLNLSWKSRILILNNLISCRRTTNDEKKLGTCDILPIVRAAIHRAVGALRDDVPNLELGEVDLPVLPGPLDGLALVLLPGLGQLLLQLEVQALQVDLVGPHVGLVLRSRRRAAARRHRGPGPAPDFQELNFPPLWETCSLRCVGWSTRALHRTSPPPGAEAKVANSA